MKFENQLLSTLPVGLLATLLSGLWKKYSRYLIYFLKGLAGFAGVIAISLLLPDKLFDFTQNILCWILISAVAGLALIAINKLLKELLDS